MLAAAGERAARVEARASERRRQQDGQQRVASTSPKRTTGSKAVLRLKAASSSPLPQRRSAPVECEGKVDDNLARSTIRINVEKEASKDDLGAPVAIAHGGRSRVQFASDTKHAFEASSVAVSNQHIMEKDNAGVPKAALRRGLDFTHGTDLHKHDKYVTGALEKQDASREKDGKFAQDWLRRLSMKLFKCDSVEAAVQEPWLFSNPVDALMRPGLRSQTIRLADKIRKRTLGPHLKLGLPSLEAKGYKRAEPEKHKQKRGDDESVADLFAEKHAREQSALHAAGLELVRHESSSNRALMSLPKSCIPSGVGSAEIHKLLRKLARLDHPSIARFIEACEDCMHLYLIYEWSSGGLLWNRIQEGRGGVEEFTEQDCAQIVRELLSAVAHASERQLYHLHWSLYSIWLQSKEHWTPVKIYGFGLAGIVCPGSLVNGNTCGRQYFYSPEFIKYKDQFNGTGDLTWSVRQVWEAHKLIASEVWACGIFAYTMLAGQPPHFGGVESEVLRKITKCEWAFSPTIQSVGAKMLIQNLLMPDYAKRPDPAQFLTDDWLATGSRPLLRQKTRIAGSVFDRLQRFANENLAVQALARIVARVLEAEDVQSLQNEFRCMDLDGNGILTLGELRALAERAQLKDCFLEELIAVVSCDGDTKIGLSEFVEAMVLESKILTDRHIHEVFNLLDAEGTGQISTQALFNALHAEAPDLTSEDVSQFIAESELTPDEGLTIEGFQRRLSKAITKDGRSERQIAAEKRTNILRQQMAALHGSLEPWREELCVRLGHLQDLVKFTLPDDADAGYKLYHQVRLELVAIKDLVRQPPSCRNAPSSLKNEFKDGMSPWFDRISALYDWWLALWEKRPKPKNNMEQTPALLQRMLFNHVFDGLKSVVTELEALMKWTGTLATEAAATTDTLEHDEASVPVMRRGSRGRAL